MATKDRTALKDEFKNGNLATGERFADLIDSMKVVQEPVADPAASGTSLSFIDSISQDADGKITPTKKTLDLENAHELNPFKGWYKTGDTLPTDGFDGAYLYFKDTSELTGQTTIYRWNGTAYADTGTVVDTSNVQTFASGQAVNGVAIDDTQLANPLPNALAKAADVKKVAEVLSVNNSSIQDLTGSVTLLNGYINVNGSVNASNRYYHTDAIALKKGESLVCRSYVLFTPNNQNTNAYPFNLVEDNVYIPIKEVLNKATAASDYSSKHISIFTAVSDCFVSANVYSSSQSNFEIYKVEIGVLFDLFSGIQQSKERVITTQYISDYAVTQHKLSPELQKYIFGIDKTSVVEFSSNTAKPFFDNIFIPTGERYKITISSDIEITQFAIFSGDAWATGRNKHDNLTIGSYEFTATSDIHNIKGYLISSNISSISTGSVSIRLEVMPNISSLADGAVTEHKLADGSVTTPKLADGAVTEHKVAFMASLNLVNPDKLVSGFIRNNSGNIGNNSDYVTTDFIPVEPNTKYCISTELVDNNRFRFRLQYDENKQPITSTYAVDYKSTLTTNANARYVRLSYVSKTFFPAVKWFLAKGERIYPYSDYKVQIPIEKVDTTTLAKEIVPPFFLPKHIYVASGRTIEIYYNQICLNAERYNIQAQCSIGKALERKFQIIGDDTHVGRTYTLTINVYNDNSKLLITASSTIHIVSNAISSAKKLLPIGDSLTNSKAWLGELSVLSSNLSTTGTRQYRLAGETHEGRSGATVSFYNTVDGTANYNFDLCYVGTHTDAPMFDSTASYNIGDYVKVPYASSSDSWSNTNIGYRVWVFTSAHTPGSFNENEAYCISNGNPFYDYANNRFSMNFYKSLQNITYDAIIIFLGTNGITLEPETNPNGALGIKTLIDNIREEEASIPIIVVNTIYRSGQNGIANQGNTDGYHAQSEYKFNADKKVMALAAALDEMLSMYTNVYLCPAGFTMDSKYDFGNYKVPVNPRITSTDVVYELNNSESIHPNTPGYMQIADEIFSTICGVFNTNS